MGIVVLPHSPRPLRANEQSPRKNEATRSRHVPLAASQKKSGPFACGGVGGDLPLIPIFSGSSGGRTLRDEDAEFRRGCPGVPGSSVKRSRGHNHQAIRLLDLWADLSGQIGEDTGGGVEIVDRLMVIDEHYRAVLGLDANREGLPG